MGKLYQTTKLPKPVSAFLIFLPNCWPWFRSLLSFSASSSPVPSHTHVCLLFPLFLNFFSLCPPLRHLYSVPLEDPNTFNSSHHTPPSRYKVFPSSFCYNSDGLTGPWSENTPQANNKGWTECSNNHLAKTPQS